MKVYLDGQWAPQHITTSETEAGKSLNTVYPVNLAQGPGCLSTLGCQDVNFQVDPLFSVFGRPSGLGGRLRTLGNTDKHLAGMA